MIAVDYDMDSRSCIARRMNMNTNAYRMILASTALVAVSAIAGCDAGQDSDPYADNDQSRSADESTYAADDQSATRDPASMDQSLASDRPGMSGGMRTAATDPATMQDSATSMAEQLTETDVVGQTVVSDSGEEIGTVVQVVDDTNGGGRVAIVDVGEFLGIGQKQVAIDMRHLRLGADGQIRSDVSADTLQSMPEYEGPEGMQEEMEEEDAE
jgi:hypothetical protein